MTSTKPLFTSGTTVTGLRVRFEGGRAVEIDADQGAEVMRGHDAADEGAARLGEVALVDREGRIGPLDTVFYDTLLDENAASHIALGHGYVPVVGDEADVERVNESDIHIDFMIGCNDVAVTGLRPTATGAGAARRRMADLSAVGSAGSGMSAAVRARLQSLTAVATLRLMAFPERCRSG